ncbi:MAG: sulfatase-like hydrolase/transferase [Verrucomicrobiales bacterium]|nr:sulfatase-like hydrolase/transferase [Verrucomicrobiales bacterium]
MTLILSFLFLNSALLADQRPNILWITSEDNGPDLGAYGVDYAHTPALDNLAEESAIYTNAFATAGVCAPARSTIITGMYPPSLGSQHMRSRAELPSGIKFYSHHLRGAGYYCTNNSKEDYNLVKPQGAWDESGRKAHWKNAPKGKPFFAIFNHTISHESKIRLREKSFPHHKIKDASIPPYHPNIRETKRDWAQYHANITKLDGLVAKTLKELDEAGLTENTIVFYYGDHGSGMPRHKRWLWDSGIHIPLLVRIPEKWKELREVQPGAKTDRLVSFVDLGPTALSLAGIDPPKNMHGKAFLGMHSEKPREFIHAFRGRMDERYDMVRAVRDKRYKYIRNYNPHQIYGQFIAYMFQTDTTRIWKEMFDQGKLNDIQSAFWKTKPPVEFYDTLKDPHEVNNLANSQSHASHRERLAAELHRWQMEIRDLGFLPEGEMHERRGKLTPYELGKNNSKYPLAKIKKAADFATKADQASLSKLKEMMGHKDSAIRYWAATGCIIVGKESKTLKKDLLNLLKDTSPDVRTASAHALFNIGESEKAVPVLEKILSEKNQFHRLRAMNVLDHMDESAKDAVTRIAKIGDSAKIGAYGENYIGNVIKKAASDLNIKVTK